MEAEAGNAFAHYIRIDKSGARPVLPDLLEAWIERGWLKYVEPPKTVPLELIPTKPCIVLDPFVGSGTTLLEARRLGRDAIGIDMSFDYLHNQARERLGLKALAEWKRGKGEVGTNVKDLPLFAAFADD